MTGSLLSIAVIRVRFGDRLLELITVTFSKIHKYSLVFVSVAVQ